MATNRFDVGLNPIQIGTPVQIPFEEIVGALGAKQEAYNQSKALLNTLDEKNFQNLQVDADFAARARQEQAQLVDNLLQMNQGDLAKGAPEIEREIRKFARRYGPSGDIGSMQVAYNKALKEYETIDKSDVPVELKQKAKQELLYSYGNIEKNSYKDAFGNTVYNQFGDAYVPKYVDVNAEALKLAKEVPLEKLAQTTGWHKSGYVWYKDSSMTEKVTFDDIVTAITPFVEGNPMVKDYLNFEAKMNTYNFGDSELGAYNEFNRRNVAQSNEELLKRKGETISKLNDPSQFKNAKEYQNYINSVFGKQVIKVDGVIGDNTEKARDRAIALVNEKMTTTNYEQKDLQGIRQDYVSKSINKAIQGAAGFYEQYNITKKDQDIKFDPWELKVLGDSLEEEITVGPTVPTLAMNTKFEGSPLISGVAKVKNGEVILESSKKANVTLAAKESYEGGNAFATAGGRAIMSLIAGWQRVYRKDRLDLSNPDLAHAKENLEHRLSAQGINTDGYSDDKWLELISQEVETKLSAAGQQSFNVVENSKSKNNWEGVWTEQIRKQGKDAFITDPLLINRQIYGTEGQEPISGDEFAKKVGKAPISYAGTNANIYSGLEYGTDVIKIGNEEFYVEPSVDTKLTKEYYSNGILRSRFGLADANYFQGAFKADNGVTYLADYKALYNAADRTYDVKVKVGDKWQDVKTYTEGELNIQPNAGQ